MKIVTLVLGCLVAACVAHTEDIRLIQVPLDQLSPEIKKKVLECEADVRAAMSFETYRNLPHAMRGTEVRNSKGDVERDPDTAEQISFTALGDGGTAFWRGNGYTMTVWHRFVSVGGVAGVLFGPEVTLAPEFTGSPSPMVVSFVRFIACRPPTEKTPNKPAAPTRTSVTPPASAGDRASGARGSP